MFTPERRAHVLDRVLEIGKTDPRITAGALVGSSAAGSQDEWSDIDITFAVAEGISIQAVLDDWTGIFEREFGALHYWDLPSGPSIYRVFLLPDGLEVDVSVTPERQFGARGPRFRTLFGTPTITYQPPAERQPDIRYHVGLGWHHVLHARSSIERGKPWRAEYWIGEIRNHVFALACLRLGEESYHGRGIDRLPASVTGPVARTLVRSLDDEELRRALAAATECFISELEAWDRALCERLRPLLLEFGTSRAE